MVGQPAARSPPPLPPPPFLPPPLPPPSPGPGHCNLTGMLSVNSDAAGRVSTRLQVLRGPFGANKIVCGEQQRCLVSVTQASLSPTEEADAPIGFAVG